MHKAGFINIIGCPNVGKSTLVNALIGERLAIVTSKAQTTRHRMMGIVNGPDYQLVISDTPGFLSPAYKLQEKMMHFVEDALEDADIFLLVSDVFEKILPSESILLHLKNTKQPVLLLLNKIDATKQDITLAKILDWRTILPNADVIPISALHKINLEIVMEKILSLLPIHEPFFDKEAMTDKSERFFVEEIIREKILLNYKKEIPYSCQVIVESFKEEEKIIRIDATIYVERDSQKAIIIGHQGNALKKTGTEARLDCETFFAKKIYLGLFVKVDKDWRSNVKSLKKFGFH